MVWLNSPIPAPKQNDPGIIPPGSKRDQCGKPQKQKPRRDTSSGYACRGRRHDWRQPSYLLLSGLYRRPRSLTGSCAFALAGSTADRELGCLALTLPRRFHYSVVPIIPRIRCSLRGLTSHGRLNQASVSLAGAAPAARNAATASNRTDGRAVRSRPVESHQSRGGPPNEAR